MSVKYRGQLKVAGSALRGWLVDVEKPARRVRFNLVIDNQFRGTYVADRRQKTVSPQSGTGEDAHSFAIPIKRVWINDGVQTVRLEDPGDPRLELSLSTRLGPAAGRHFDEHVVSGQVMIGARAPAISQSAFGQTREDSDGTKPYNAESVKLLLKQIEALSDDELTGLVVAIDRDVLLDRIGRYERANDWQSNSTFRRLFHGDLPLQMSIAFGRSAIKAHNYALAGRVLGAAAALHPKSFEANYQASVAKFLLDEFEESARHLRVAIELEEGTFRAKRQLAVLLAKQLRGELEASRRSELQSEHIALLRALSQSDDAGARNRHQLSLASALYASERHADAIAAADVVLAVMPDDTRALMVKAKALVARNAVADAHALFEKVLMLEPNHRGAQTNLRVLDTLIGEGVVANDGVAQRAKHAVDDAQSSGHGSRNAASSSPHSKQHFVEVSQDWVCTSGHVLESDEIPHVLAELETNGMRRFGCATLQLEKRRRLQFWRQEVLIGLEQSGLIDRPDDIDSLAHWKSYYGARRRGHLSPVADAKGIAAIVARGGEDRFLLNVAAYYASHEFEPMAVDLVSSGHGQKNAAHGIRQGSVGDTAAELRKFLLENDVSLVHAVSGTGSLILESLRFTNIPFVYGIHSWADALEDSSCQKQAGVDGRPASPKEGLFSVLSHAAMIYAGSRFIQKIAEENLGIRYPIAHAVRDE
jgi:tetratricopeptide (TPR) repeat protein